jgi:hypothetical protein
MNNALEKFKWYQNPFGYSSLCQLLSEVL